MNYKKATVLKCISIMFSSLLLKDADAQLKGIAINDNNAVADASAMLDISVNMAAAKKGILIPRITTTQRDAITTPATSLLIYNSTNARFEYYTGSSWQPLTGSSSGWGLTGNGGTSESGNFIGTTDGQGLVFKVNNAQAGYLGLSGSSYATSFGIGASATFKSTAVGAGAQTSANEAVAIGYNANTSSQQSVAIGSGALASSNESVAEGYNSNASGYRSIAIGSGAQALTSSNVIALGYDAQSSTYQSIVIGASSRGSNNQTISLGTTANASGYQAIAIGTGAVASAQNSMALGNGASVTTANYISIGNNLVQAIRGQVNFTTYSDGRFKRNIHADVPGLLFINKLKPVTYTWDIHSLNNYTMNNNNDYHVENASYNKTEENAIREKEKIRYTGFIAQEVEKAADESGFNFSGVVKPKDNKDIYALSYAEFVVPLVKASQELNDKNEALVKRVNEQQIIIDDLAKRLKKLEQKK